MSFKTKHQASKAFQLCGQLSYGPRLFPELLAGSLLWLGSGQLENLWPRQWSPNLAVLQNVTHTDARPSARASESGGHPFRTWMDFYVPPSDRDALQECGSLGWGLVASSDAQVDHVLI